MPLFACETCNAVENTALGDYWTAKVRGQPVKCSECRTGQWHGKFPKEDASEWEPDPNDPGFLRHPDEASET